MKRHIALAMTLTLAAAAAACTGDEADIGTDHAPVVCSAAAEASVDGSIDQADGTAHEFGPAQVTLANDPAGAPLVNLYDNYMQLRFQFYCGSQEVATYDVVDPRAEANNLQSDCPLAVLGSVYGQTIQFTGGLQAAGDTLIIDENQDCLAGRFSTDFGDYGALSGWFSSPWPQQQ